MERHLNLHTLEGEVMLLAQNLLVFFQAIRLVYMIWPPPVDALRFGAARMFCYDTNEVKWSKSHDIVITLFVLDCVIYVVTGDYDLYWYAATFIDTLPRQSVLMLIVNA